VSDPDVIAPKPAIARDAHAKGRLAEDAARLQQALAAHESTT
jgi:hypothetical protein